MLNHILIYLLFTILDTLYKHLNEVHLKKARALKKTLNQKEILRENDVRNKYFFTGCNLHD